MTSKLKKEEETKRYSNRQEYFVPYLPEVFDLVGKVPRLELNTARLPLFITAQADDNGYHLAATAGQLVKSLSYDADAVLFIILHINGFQNGT